MKRLYGVIVMAIVAIFFLSAIGSSTASYVPPFSSTVSVPAYATTGENLTMYVNDTLGFSNYTVTVYLSGENLTGISPSFSYHNFQATNPDFTVHILAPKAAQTLYIKIVSGADYGSKYVTTVNTYTVTVIAPIIFYATVTNTGTFALHNLTVNFTVDGEFVGSVVAPAIAPGSAYTVNFTYVNPYLTQGEHTLTVTVNNKAVSIDGSAAVYTTHFYYGKPPNYNWIFYVAAVVIAFMVFLALTAGRKSTAPSKPKWRK